MPSAAGGGMSPLQRTAGTWIAFPPGRTGRFEATAGSSPPWPRPRTTSTSWTCPRTPRKNAFVDAVRETLYDVVITDPYFLGDVPFTWREVKALKRKPCGGNRFVLAYLSIGEAEDYRPYWNPSWKRIPPPWLEKENEDWPGNYKVRYWMEEWQKILLGGEGSCLDRIVEAGFDGVVLDIIDAFYYFEEKVRAD